MARNITYILSHFKVFRIGCNFCIDVPSENPNGVKNTDEVRNKAKYTLFQCISFLNNLYLLYDDKYKGTGRFTPYKKPNNSSESRPKAEERYPLPIEYLYRLKKDDVEPMRVAYELALRKEDGGYILTDQGGTYALLDDVYELDSPDVIKKINNIMDRCDVFQSKDEFYIKIEGNYENDNSEKIVEAIKEAKYRLLECVSFMDNMRIFFIS